MWNSFTLLLPLLKYHYWLLICRLLKLRAYWNQSFQLTKFQVHNYWSCISVNLCSCCISIFASLSKCKSFCFLLLFYLLPFLILLLYAVCVHGSYRKNLESILESGLKRMRRLHVHFSCGLPTDGEVISGNMICYQKFLFMHVDV